MIKKINILFCILFTILITVGCGIGENKDGQISEVTELPQFMDVNEDEPVVIIYTSKGNITLKLFPTYAPKAVEKFITNSKNKYYNGLTFHRVIPGFMIQVGDPLENETEGGSIYSGPFESEISPNLAHFSGAVSMANSGPNSNTSQFFIVESTELYVEPEELRTEEYPVEIIEKYQEYGGAHWLDNKHTIFGQVIAGMDIVHQIASVKVDPNDKPIEPIIIETIAIEK